MTETFNEVAQNRVLHSPDFQTANLWSERTSTLNSKVGDTQSGLTASNATDCLPCCDFIDTGAGSPAGPRTDNAARVGLAIEADRARCDTPPLTPRPQDHGTTQGVEATAKFPIFRPTNGGADIPPITPIMPPPTGREWGLPLEVGAKSLKEAEGSAKAERVHYPPTRHPWSTR